MKSDNYKSLNITYYLLQLIFLTYMLVGNSCKKEECYYRSEVQLANWTNDPYNFLVNDSFYATIQGHDSLLVVLKPDYYNFKLVQVSGFDSIPNIKEEKYFAMDPCTITWWSVWD